MSKDSAHRFSKEPTDLIHLIEGIGVAGDAHAGVTVQHRSRVARDPTQPNFRQVHLLTVEFFEDANEQGYRLNPGDLGENILTAGLYLLSLPTGTRLRLGPLAVVTVTGLRNPCRQIESFRTGLLKVAVERRGDDIVRKAGIMSVVSAGGPVRPGDDIHVELPPPPHSPLIPV